MGEKDISTTLNRLLLLFLFGFRSMVPIKSPPVRPTSRFSSVVESYQ